MNRYTLNEILSVLGPSACFEGAYEGSVSVVSPISSLVPESLSFITGRDPQVSTLLSHVRHCVIICTPELQVDQSVLQENSLIRIWNPKLAFIRVLKALFEEKRNSGVHPTACVHSSVELGQDVYIGPNVVIEEGCALEEGCTLEAGVVLYRRTRVGAFTHINAGSFIGKEGLGHVPTDSGEWINFPHLGGVVIGKKCMIGCGVSIDRGTLSDTRIGEGVLIDSQAHIGHNSQVGDHTLIAGGVIVSGSVTIGQHVYIGPQATLSDGISIGDRAKISIGSTVINTVPQGGHVTGYFAQDHRKYLKKMMDDHLKFFK